MPTRALEPARCERCSTSKRNDSHDINRSVIRGSATPLQRVTRWQAMRSIGLCVRECVSECESVSECEREEAKWAFYEVWKRVCDWVATGILCRVFDSLVFLVVLLNNNNSNSTATTTRSSSTFLLLALPNHGRRTLCANRGALGACVTCTHLFALS
jgi:hypothetical protein